MSLFSFISGVRRPSNPQIMPSVQLAPQVIAKIQRGAMLYPDSETGEALVGVAASVEGKVFPQVTVLDTIPPRTAMREWAVFEQGDDWQASVFNWLNENWELYRKLRQRSYGQAVSAKWDLPLQHLGDWHKQPGSMTAPSGGDLHTAKRLMKEEGRDFLIAPIATFVDPLAEVAIEENTLLLEGGRRSIRLDFWGIRQGDRGFMPLKPEVKQPYGLPRLPEAVWWLHDGERMEREIATLEKQGYHLMDVVQFDADGVPPLETCFALHRVNSYHVLLAITPHTYPKQPPQWRTAKIRAPQPGKGLFESLYEHSTPVPATILTGWRGDQHALLDGARMIEATLEPA